MAMTVELSSDVIDAIEQVIPVNPVHNPDYITLGQFEQWMYDTYQAKTPAVASFRFEFDDPSMYMEFCLRWL